VYSEYIKAYLPKGDTSMDYMLMTHFHNDHFGTTNAQEDYPMDSRDGYKYPLTGIMALYDEVPFDKIIDRAFDENSDYLTDVPATGQDYSDGYGYYGQFVTWARAKKGLVVEKAVNGSDSQLALVTNPSGYPDFKIQINAVNGWYWDGSKSVDAYYFNRLLGKQPGENGNSISFLLSYGDFDYLTSGDAGANTRIENNLAKSINRKIEAMKAHHHFAWETMSATSMAIYQPTVVVSQSFYDHQPDMGYYDSGNQAFQLAWAAYGNPLNTPEAIAEAHDPSNPACKCWYFTNIHQHIVDWNENNYIFGADGNVENQMPKIKGMNGHVVIRVAPKGADGKQQFYVYMLVDTDFGYVVKQADGPFYCHEN
jgi:hypothetical protein